MMKTKLTTSCLIASLLMLPVAGIAADSATTYVKDSAITTQVKAELAADKMTSLFNIGVDTDHKGAVTLSGTVKSKAALDKAAAITRAVKGVVSVDNQIKVVADK